MNVISYCNRPFKDAIEMNREMITRHNDLVRPSDTVYMVGDIAFGPIAKVREIIEKLNGHKILVRGNHDHYSHAAALRCGFVQSVQTLDIDFDGKRFFLRHKRALNPVSSFYVHIHGHSHTGPRIAQKCVNVCVDLWDYRPVSIDQVRELVDASS